MDKKGSLKGIFRKILQDSNSLLDNTKFCPFSRQAKTALIGTIETIAEQLVADAVRIAKNNRADIVSENDVKKANDHLIHSSKKTKLFSHIGYLGGIIFGAFLSTLLSVVFTQEYYTLAIIFLSVSGIAGVFMIILYFSGDL